MTSSFWDEVKDIWDDIAGYVIVAVVVIVAMVAVTGCGSDSDYENDIKRHHEELQTSANGNIALCKWDETWGHEIINLTCTDVTP
jgi:hypothetical protein